MSECDSELFLLTGLSRGFPQHDQPPEKERRRRKETPKTLRVKGSHRSLFCLYVHRDRVI